MGGPLTKHGLSEVSGWQFLWRFPFVLLTMVGLVALMALLVNGLILFLVALLGVL